MEDQFIAIAESCAAGIGPAFVETAGVVRQLWQALGASEDEVANMAQTFAEAVKSFIVERGKDLNKQLDDEVARLEKVNAEIGETRHRLLAAGIWPGELETIKFNGHGIVRTRELAEATLNALQRKVEAIMMEFRGLRTRELALCDELACPPTPAPEDPTIPPAGLVEEVRRHVVHLEDTRAQGARRRDEIVQTVKQFYLELGERPTEAELEVLNRPNLHPETFEQIEKLRAQLKVTMDKRCEQAMCFQEKIRRLWDALGVPAEVRSAFLANHMGFTRANLDVLHNELRKLSEQREFDAERLVPKMQGDIMKLAEGLLYEPETMAELRITIEAFAGPTLVVLEALDKKKAELEKQLVSRGPIVDQYKAWEEKLLEWERCLEGRKTEEYKKNRCAAMAVQAKQEEKIGSELAKMTQELLDSIADFEKKESKKLQVKGRLASAIVAEEIVKPGFPRHRCKPRAVPLSAAALRGPPPSALRNANRTAMKAPTVHAPRLAVTGKKANPTAKKSKIPKPTWRSAHPPSWDDYDSKRRPGGPGGFVFPDRSASSASHPSDPLPFNSIYIGSIASETIEEEVE